MIHPEYLYARRCVRDLTLVVEQVDWRTRARWPVPLDPSTVAMLILWTILRGERTFLLICLEDLGFDFGALTRELDDLINQRKAARTPGRLGQAADDGFDSSSRYLMDRLTWEWLNQAEQEAVALRHPYLGAEHLLLAVIAGADAGLASLLARHGLDHDRVRDAVLAALASRPPTEIQVFIPSPRRRGAPWGARWDTPAVGVPRQFSLAMALLMMALYAVLFATLRVLHADPEVFIVVAVFFTGVGVGQTLLFGGKYPRAASIWVGAGLFPIECVTWYVYASYSGFAHDSRDAAGIIFALLLFCTPLGAGLGYLAGCVAAGMFFVSERYFSKTGSAGTPEEKEPDPIGERTPDATQQGEGNPPVSD
jgi:hypothetical protein